MSIPRGEETAVKLNYKRTFLIGFAFFGILLLWQVYDSWCPTFLTDIFARRFYGMSSADLKASDPNHILHVQWIVGIIMARLISSVMGTPTAISVPAILIAVVFSMIIGIVFGLLPAVKASNLNPIQALRRD